MKRRRWNAIEDRLPLGQKRIVGVEIGVWQAKNAVRLLSVHKNLTLYLVDEWKAPEPGSSFAVSGAQMAAYPQEKFDEAKAVALARLEAFGDRARVLELDSVAAAVEIKRRRVKLGFIFIDSDHSYEGVKRDLEAWAPFLEDVLWIAGHDYGNTNGEVKRAVDEYFAGKSIDLDIDHCWFVWAHDGRAITVDEHTAVM